MASSRRIEKVNILLRDEVARIVDRDIELPEDSFLTLTRVDTSSDVHYATVFISVLGGEEEAILEILAKNIYHIQQLLNRRVRMRPVPKIRFAIDEQELAREAVEKGFAKIRRQGEL